MSSIPFLDLTDVSGWRDSFILDMLQGTSITRIGMNVKEDLVQGCLN
jgi:hypothetical protein